jgi:linoleoyl-CoA desaturase
MNDHDRFRLFAEELDQLKARTLAQIGEEDLAYVKRLDRFSRTLEVFGRALIFVSPDPISFLAGTGALFLHKQIQTTEIGHTALHGAYDKLDPGGKYDSRKFRWDTPIDEESWRYAHNVRHHGNTNIAGKDADVNFGHVRLTDKTEKSMKARWELMLALSVIFPNFLMVINSHVTGVNDLVLKRNEFLPDHSKESKKLAWKKALRKYVPQYLKEYFFFPALAGPLAPKVLLGNYLACLARDVYSAATIFCGHVGPEVKSWPEGTRPKTRGEWYAMQVESANDFRVPLPLSILCGGLDYQIEHHLFPSLPPHRLREIAPEVEAICKKHGVAYRAESWPQTLRKVFTHLDSLAA